MSARRDFPITKHFRLREFERSDSKPHLVEAVPDSLLPNVIAFAVLVLEPLRIRFGKIEILSGYRPERLNRAVGGSPTSQHMLGEAADVVFHDADNADVVRALRRAWGDWRFGQLIWYPVAGFVHIASPSKRYPGPSFFVVRNGTLQRLERDE